MQPLCGPFIDKEQKNLKDSEGRPAHPAPRPELKVSGEFVDTWGKLAGKIKFANTHKIGVKYPRFDQWLSITHAEEPLYFHAALPVYSGLIWLGDFVKCPQWKSPEEPGSCCLHKYGSNHKKDHPREPEWIRACDVALVGIALYAEDELVPSFSNPPVDPHSMRSYGHLACNFIPGSTSTYAVDHTWVGASFCLAPNDTDFEIRDDIYNIEQYYNILKMYCPQSAEERREVNLTVNLLLSTNYLANVRAVCAGSIKVEVDRAGLDAALTRLEDIRNSRYNSKFALEPVRPTKNLSVGESDPENDGISSTFALADRAATPEPTTAIRAKSMAQPGLRYGDMADPQAGRDNAPPEAITAKAVASTMARLDDGSGPASLARAPPPPPGGPLPPQAEYSGMFGGRTDPQLTGGVLRS